MDGLTISKVAYVCANKELETRMNLINEAIITGEKAVFDIGQQLKEIKDGELWKEDYNDFVECASQFNIKKAQAYNLIQAYNTKQKYNLDGYTSTHCLQIARFENKKGEKAVKKALEGGQIKSDMSVSALKAYIDKRLGTDKKALECRNTKAVNEQGETDEQAAENASPVTSKEENIVGAKELVFKVYYDINTKEYSVVMKDETKVIDAKTFKKIEELILK